MGFFAMEAENPTTYMEMHRGGSPTHGAERMPLPPRSAKSRRSVSNAEARRNAEVLDTALRDPAWWADLVTGVFVLPGLVRRRLLRAAPDRLRRARRPSRPPPRGAGGGVLRAGRGGAERPLIHSPTVVSLHGFLRHESGESDNLHGDAPWRISNAWRGADAVASAFRQVSALRFKRRGAAQRGGAGHGFAGSSMVGRSGKACVLRCSASSDTALLRAAPDRRAG